MQLNLLTFDSFYNLGSFRFVACTILLPVNTDNFICYVLNSETPFPSDCHPEDNLQHGAEAVLPGVLSVSLPLPLNTMFSERVDGRCSSLT